MASSNEAPAVDLRVEDEYTLRAALPIVTASFFFYCLVNKILSFWQLAEFVDHWKWRNLATSMTHALICGTWACYSLYNYPELMSDLLNFANACVFAMACSETGYFLFDMADILWFGKLFECWEVSLHHALVATAMVYNVSTATFLGYQVAVMSLEVNGVFLHLRKLLQMMRQNRTRKTVYNATVCVNLVTFLVFRGFGLGTATAGLYLEVNRMPFWFYCFIAPCVIIIDIINVIFFYKLFKNDVIRRKAYGTKKSTDHVPSSVEDTSSLHEKSNGEVEKSNGRMAGNLIRRKIEENGINNN